MSDTAIRYMLTSRIVEIIHHSLSANHQWRYKSMRWNSCQVILYEHALGLDLNSKKSKKEISTIDPSDRLLINKLTDVDFSKYFEEVVRCAYTQM